MSNQTAGEHKRDPTQRQQFAEANLDKIDASDTREENEKASLEGHRATFRNLMGWPFVLIPAAAIVVGNDVHSFFTLVLIWVFAICHIRMVRMGGQEVLILPDHQQSLRRLIYILLAIYLSLGLPALICVGYAGIQSIQFTQTVSTFDLEDVLLVFIQACHL